MVLWLRLALSMVDICARQVPALPPKLEHTNRNASSSKMTTLTVLRPSLSGSLLSVPPSFVLHHPCHSAPSFHHLSSTDSRVRCFLCSKNDTTHRPRYIRCMFELLNSSSHAVKYEATMMLTTLTQNPAAVKAAASCFVNLDAGIQTLGGGLELWRGYFQSVHPTISKNIDVSTVVMFKQGSFQTAALAVLKQNDVRALDLHPDLPQFRQLKKGGMACAVILPSKTFFKPSMNFVSF
ncbi:uncharacterized protein HD556DRAFT_1396350 [Suillus plorans]|uniref:Argonaute linker 1 domain-containing protein n=1 Tax=Suillus plorans TaxID=116603 RepID=A0A9P7DDY5_9AGAM|nr:uncharacterized protein HD556DRAFT_1396350 [Suillus plorans]KAG1789584.1 hypothetical protein HD556DRAFT_1396350 [Suillus plorans]